MTIPHSEMNLRDYVRVIVPTLKPELREYYLRKLAGAADHFCDWVGHDLAIADVSPEMADEFRDSGRAGAVTYAKLLWSVLRIFDPMTFRCRKEKKGKQQLDCGDGSEFLLANLYLKRYEPTALRTRRPNTKRLYETTLRTFDKFLNRSATLDDLNDDTVAQYAAWRVKTVAKTSVNKDLFNLLALWRWCNRKGLVDSWPDVQLEAPAKRTPVAWTEAQIRKLYKTMSQLPGRVGHYRARNWWPALLLVCFDSGERISAVMALSWDRVDLDSRWIRFRAEERKGGREDSAVRLGPDAVKALRKIRADDGPVFPWPFSSTYLWHELSRIQKLAGLPTDCKSKFHRIRRTVASHAEAAGANATAMLRHSKREITESYLDPKIVKQQQPSDVLFRLAE